MPDRDAWTVDVEESDMMVTLEGWCYRQRRLVVGDTMNLVLHSKDCFASATIHNRATPSSPTSAPAPMSQVSPVPAGTTTTERGAPA
jgi:hypothetical protein